MVRMESPGRLDLEDGTVLSIDGTLPADLPWGYHRFFPDGHDGSVRVIVAPRDCLLPEPMWGWAVQLYAARSQESWGIGDLADLRRLAQWSAGLHAGMILVNPLGAVAPVLPQADSPYFPSSRRFLNPLYLRVEEVPGARRLGAELERSAAAGRALLEKRRIDRDAVFRLKDAALRKIWAGWAHTADFDCYCGEMGSELRRFSAYCALAAQFGGDWRQWPPCYRTPQSPAVETYVQEHAREVAYHEWLQWLLDRQLAAAAGPLALMQDLPIGVAPGGADAWVWQDLLANDCTVGAPPDLFNTAGQDWSIPPFVPHRLQAAGYEPFIETIRAVLRHAGGLRIDHVMGLYRLYWIPQGFGPERGAYVRYPAGDLLSIVALESRRAGAFVVGEDLGTVEDGVREDLHDRRVLSFRVLWFENKPPSQYPERCMAAVSTHDLPTLAGVWTGQDEAAQRAIGLDPGENMELLRKHVCGLIAAGEETPVPEAIERAYRLLATAPARIVSATLDDAMAVPERPNMPGTVDQWPNWRLALPKAIESLEASDLPGRIAHALHRSRTTGGLSANDYACSQPVLTGGQAASGTQRTVEDAEKLPRDDR
jgi:4-alpha-glucanotransferase